MACLAAIFLVLLPLAAVAQSGASFTVKNSATTWPNDTPIVVDLNGDGIPDLVEISSSAQTSHALTVQLGHGDGTFGAPTNYPMPVVNGTSGETDTPPLTADFNHDGHADVVLPVIISSNLSSPQTYVQFYMGNGNGTLAPPVNTIVSGALEAMAASDFNRDGNVDLLAYDGSTRNIELLLGDGHGNFSAPTTIMTLPTTEFARMFQVGDFDADAKADVAMIILVCPCQSGFVTRAEIHILYGNGTGGFTDSTALTYNNADGLNELTAGDLNDDGATDLVSMDTESSNSSVFVTYGSKSRTPSTKTLSSGIAAGSDAFAPTVAIADFNGDLHNDFAFWGTLNGTPQLELMLGNVSGGFKTQRIALPSGQAIGSFVASDFDRNRKPDIGTLFFTFPNSSSGTATTKAFLDTTSGGHFAPCAFPAAASGLHVCTPVASSTITWPVHFTMSGTWFQNLRKAELWIDGTKVAEQHFGWDKSFWFDQTREILPGTHKATFFTAGMDNQLQKTSVTFTVSTMQGCSHPGSVGIHICSPLNSSIWGGGVLGQAAATVSGTPSHMELWVDGVKTFSQSGSTMNAGMNLKPGLHRFTFYAVNTAGTRISATVMATTQ